ncbi:hypothetical protein FRB99_006512 [Tulasnella sp. 403]|nr:hypothetical protein FRB99_006512 [Tulasnella sp. 403]
MPENDPVPILLDVCAEPKPLTLPIKPPTLPVDQLTINGVLSSLQQLREERFACIEDAPSQPSSSSQPSQYAGLSSLRNLQGQLSRSPLRLDPQILSELALTMLAFDLTDEVLHLLRSAYHDKVSVSMHIYATTCSHLQHLKKWHLIPPLQELSELHLGRTSFRLLEARTLALINLCDISSLRSTLKSYSKAGYRPPPRTYSKLLKTHVQAGDPAGVQDIMSHMKANKVSLSPKTYGAILLGARKVGLTAKVRQWVRETLGGQSPPTTLALNAALDLFIKDRDVRGARDALRRFDLPQSGGRQARTSEASTSTSTGLVPPDATTYAMLIDLYASQSLLSPAIQVFQKALQTGVTPNTHMTAALVNAYIKSGDVYGALCILKEMCKGHALYEKGAIDPFWKAFQKFLDAPPLGKKRSEDLEGTLKMCDWRSVQLHPKHFTALLDGVIPEHGRDVVVPIFEVLRALRLPFARSVLTVVAAKWPEVSGAAYTRIVDIVKSIDAKTLSMHHDLSSASTYTIEVSNAVLRTLIRRRRNHSQGSRLPRTRRYKSRLPTQRQATTSIRYHSSDRLKLPRRYLTPLFRKFKRRGTVADRHTYVLRIRHEAHRTNPQGAKAAFDAMVSRGFKPQVRHYAALMEGYVRVGQMGEAKRLMRRYEEGRMFPDIDPNSRRGKHGGKRQEPFSRVGLGVGNILLWTILIVGYGHLGQPDKARSAMEELIREGLTPDVASVDALANAYLSNKQHRLARTVVLDFWPAEYVGALTEEVKRLPVKRLLRAMRMQSGVVKVPGQPPRWRGFTKREAMELGACVGRIAKAWRGKRGVRQPKAESGSLTTGASPRRRTQAHVGGTLGQRHTRRYPAVSWSERQW